MPRPDELSGWKAIADYLGCGIRTAQEHEKDRGLPIYHQPGPRGRVFAYPEELDSWRTKKQVAVIPSPENVTTQEPARAEILPAPDRRRWLRSALWTTSALIGAGGLGVLAIKIRQAIHQPPSAYRVEGATLIVSGRDDVELWRHTFPMQLGMDIYTDPAQKVCMFADLDGDGRTETIFHYRPNNLHAEQPLVCFSQSGKLLWQFVPGKEVTDNLGHKHAPPYEIPAFEVVRSKTGPCQVVVSSTHHFSFPTQVAVLDGKTGQVISEYWHRGHLRHIAVADLDGDGEAEVVLGGVNDAPEYKQATVLVFDHRRVSGSTKTPNGAVYFQGMSPGSEKKVLLFPRTPVSQLEEFNRVETLHLTPDRIAVPVAESIRESGPSIVYEFDYSFRLTNAVFSGQLVKSYRELQAAGKLPKGDLDFYALAAELGGKVRVI